MTISRMQQPRQLYGLGSLVKSVKKAVKKVVKSPIGKAALLYGATLPFGGPMAAAKGLGGFFGAGSFNPLKMMMTSGPNPGSLVSSPFGRFLGTKLGKTAAIAGASALGGLFAGKTEEEVEAIKSDPTALRAYLRDYYTKLNPNATSEEVEQFVTTNSSEYADGGRVGYAVGSPGPASPRIRPTGGALSRAPAPGTMPSPFAPATVSTPSPASTSFIPKVVPKAIPLPKAVPAGIPSAKTVSQLGSAQGGGSLFNQVLQYLSRTPSTPVPTITPRPSGPSVPTSPPKFDYGPGAFLSGGGMEDTRTIALQNLSELGYNVDRFIDKSSKPSIGSTPTIAGPAAALGMFPGMKFKDEATLSKLLNPQIGSLQTDLISVLREAKDIGRNYTIDQALKLTEKDILEISDLYNKKNKLGPYAPRQRSTYTGPTDFRMVGGVAVPKAEGGRVGYADGSDFSKDRQYKLWEKRYKKNPESMLVTQHEKFKEYKEFYDRQNKAMGGNIVDQASGIMGLPKRVNKAGVKELDLRKSGGFIPPVGVKEKADDIPAMLSNNEFVFTADAVRGMGNGNVNLGAQRMYDMMKKLEKGGRA